MTNRHAEHQGQIVVSAVGLPARGKTAVSRSLERYMRWLGVSVKGAGFRARDAADQTVFSLGDYVRSTRSDAR